MDLKKTTAAESQTSPHSSLSLPRQLSGEKPTRLLSPSEAATVLGVTTPTLAVWRCTKRYPGLQYIKVGRSVRYRAEAVEAFINSRTV